MKKIFISQPMNGLSDDEIKEYTEKILKTFSAIQQRPQILTTMYMV